MTLREQLAEAWERERRRNGRTLAWLVEAAGLDIDSTSLGRKLNGRQVMTTSEGEAIARVLKKRISYDGRDTRMGRAA